MKVGIGARLGAHAMHAALVGIGTVGVVMHEILIFIYPFYSINAIIMFILAHATIAPKLNPKSSDTERLCPTHQMSKNRASYLLLGDSK